MDYEKRYKEALERARKLYKDAITLQLEQDIKDYEHIFPELKESEDEKIRKRLLALIEWSKSYAASGITTDEAKEMLAWLEKQRNIELLKVKGFLVRDKDDYTAIYAEKPHRGKTEWVNGNDSCLMTINDARLVPDIEFEDEPVEVEVTLKRV